MSSKGQKLKGKIYRVEVGDQKLLVKAKTRQGALAYAAERLMTCEYADQNALYELTKAGVERVDTTVDEAQPLLPGVEVAQ